MHRAFKASPRLRRLLAAASTAAALALVFASPAAAAGVVNGGFETGTLEGWSLYQSSTGVTWTVLNAAEAEGAIPMKFPPIEGSYSAYAEDLGPGTAILYQDVALGAGTTDQLKFSFGYSSEGEMMTPPDGSLELREGVPDQQLRIDVIKPTAPLESVAPEDVLATIFATHTGSPRELAPQVLNADLSAFAGQTVRLRFTIVEEEGLNAVVDGVQVASNPIPPPAVTPAPELGSPPPSNAFTGGALKLDKRTGRGTLLVNVPGAGTLITTDARRKVAVASRRRKGKARPLYVRTATTASGGAGAIRVPIRPTPAALKVLRRRGSLPVRLTLTFTPTGGTAASQDYAGRLVKLRPARVRR